MSKYVFWPKSLPYILTSSKHFPKKHSHDVLANVIKTTITYFSVSWAGTKLRTHIRTRTHGIGPVPVPVPMTWTLAGPVPVPMVSYPYPYPYPYPQPRTRTCTRTRTRTHSHGLVPQNALVLILLCHVHFWFLLVFLVYILPCILFYLFLFCKALWSIVERRYSKHCLCMYPYPWSGTWVPAWIAM